MAKTENIFGELSGGNAPNLGVAPDAFWANNGTALAGNGTATVTVTQKPRYVVVLMIHSTTNIGLMGFYDTENESAYLFGYWSGAVQDGTWSNYSSYITSVTSSSVTVKQVFSSNANVRTWVNCYY